MYDRDFFLIPDLGSYYSELGLIFGTPCSNFNFEIGITSIGR